METIESAGVPTALELPADVAALQHKANPVCLHAGLKEEAMSAGELSQLCFEFEVPPTLNLAPEPAVVSSSSSTSSRESFHLSETEIKSTPLKLERDTSAMLNAKVTSRKMSRIGRSSQRWITAPQSHHTVRLVTGCVPIVEGGRILLISSSKKPEWILPKGGWELDETMEESAIREGFEEAGILGVLGPRLSDFQYETRKAKKRRLSKFNIVEESYGESKVQKTSDVKPSDLNSSDDEALFGTQVTTVKQSDETSSVASDASQSYTHVRLSLFPLFVTDVKTQWPECGRFRKAVDIDTAIEMMESRPELKAALVEVKEKGIHLLSTQEQGKGNR